MFLLLAFELNSDQLKDTTIMISISFLVFILCRTTGSKPNLARSDLLLEGKLNSRTKFRGGWSLQHWTGDDQVDTTSPNIGYGPT